MTEIVTDLVPPPELTRDVRLIGLVGGAHGLSHFYQLVLPPLFPLLTAAFGVGYAELGLVIALGYAAAGLMQTPAGILVDRLGPAPLLIGGLALYSGAMMLIGLIPEFWLLAPLLIVAELGDSVFHPADYAIMNGRIGADRLGRAYAVHSLAGNIGWVLAPASVLGLTALFGWRAAVMILGAGGVVFALFLSTQRSLLGGRPHPTGQAKQTEPAPGRVLLSAPILMAFLYFALLSIALTGVQSFLPSALPAVFGVSVAAASAMLTLYLIAASAGVLIGGYLADRFPRHEIVVAIGLGLGGAFSLGFALPALPVAALWLVAGLAGLALGAIGPARDMLVRGATPPGATGKVFGFVYSGLNLGSIIATPLLGLLLDRGWPRLVFVVPALALVAAIATAFALAGAAPQTSDDAAERPA